MPEMRVAALIASVLLVAGCGGGGGGGAASAPPSQPTPPAGPSPPAAAASPGGIWFVPGTMETAVTMFIAESGVLKAFDAGWLGTGAVIVVNGNEVAGSYERIKPQGVVADPRELRQSCEVVGSVAVHASLSLTLRCEDWQGTIDARTLTFMYDARYERGSSLDGIAGNYAVPVAALTNTLSINNDGTVFGAFQNGGADCTVNGLVELIDSDFTIYGIEITLSSCARLTNVYEGATMSGLVIGEAPGAAAGAFLLLTSLSVDGGLTIYSLLYEPV